MRRKRWGINSGSAAPIRIVAQASSPMSLLMMLLSLISSEIQGFHFPSTVRSCCCSASRKKNRFLKDAPIEVPFPNLISTKGRAGRGGRQGGPWRVRQLAASASSLDDYPAQEVQEMEDLILSLSREATDSSRRSRVEALFRDALVAPSSPAEEDDGDGDGDVEPARFTSLFSLVLVSVGNRVQEEAQQRQMMLQDPPSSVADDTESLSSSTTISTPSDLNFQLWALVDMMVQSKTLVKRARGELGKDGSFG
jgi:hypothetical protein